MNKKHFLLLFTALCLCIANAWGAPEEITLTVSTGGFSVTNDNRCDLGGTRCNFYIEKTNGNKLKVSGKNLQFESGTTAYLRWSGVDGFEDLTVVSVSAEISRDLDWGRERSFEMGSTTDAETNSNARCVISWSNDGTKSFNISDLGYTLERGSSGIFLKSGGTNFFIKSISITYTVSPATYQFKAVALSPTEANVKVSFVNGSYSSMRVTGTQSGVNVAANNAEKTAYFSAPASYVDNSDVTYYFEGWYRVNVDGTPSAYRHSDLANCDSTFVSSSIDSSNPDSLRLYAKYTIKYVPAFVFNLKFAVVGDGTYANVFTTDCPLPLTSVTSSDESVATVSANLEDQTVDVTIVGRGRTSITISQTGDDDWLDKTVSYSILVVNPGEWIWQQDEVKAALSYYVYDTVSNSGFMNTANPAGFDAISAENPTLWVVSGSFPSSYSLTANDGANEMAFCKPSLDTPHIQTHNNEKSGDDLIITSALSADGYYCLYRKNTFFLGGNRHAKSDGNGKIVTHSDNCYEWVFVSPAQKAAYDSYVVAFDYVGDFAESNPDLDTELRAVVGANNFTSTNWVTCKANLDAIIAKCNAFDADYAKFNEEGNKHTISTTADGFATIYYACPIELPNGVTAYKGAYSDGVLTLTDIDRDGYVPASTPVLLHNDDGSNTSIVLTYYNGNVSSVTGNKLHGTSNAITLSGTTVDIDDVSGTPYGLGQKNNHAGFYRYANNGTISANKAFLVIDDGASLAAIRIVREENTTTDVEMFDSTNTSTVIKFFENGQLFIKRDGVIYDAIGRKIR